MVNLVNYQLLFRTVELRSKVGCTSTIKIKALLFCISFGLHYLCKRKPSKTLKPMKQIMFVMVRAMALVENGNSCADLIRREEIQKGYCLAFG